MKTELRHKQDRFTLRGDFEKDRNDGKVTDENRTLFNKYDYFLSKQLFWGGALYLEHDKFADLNLRTNVGPHIGYQFFETAAINLSANWCLIACSSTTGISGVSAHLDGIGR